MGSMNGQQMESMIVEPTQTEPLGCWQRWCECWLKHWRKLTLAWKIACTSIFIVSAAVIIYMCWPSNGSKENANSPDSKLENPDVYFMKSLDQNMQPCKDFYSFACAKLRNEYGKENKDRFDTMAMMGKSARVALDDLLTRPLNASDSAMLRELKIFQQMCINQTKVDAEGISPVLIMLSQMGGWPLLTNGSGSDQTWEEIVGSVNRAGFATVFPYHLGRGTRLSLEPLLDPKRPRVLPNEQRTTDYVKVVASLLNGTNDRIEDDIRNCIDFETELEEITNSVDEGGKKYTLESLSTNYSEIAWKSFFRNAFISTDIEVSSNETVRLPHWKYNSKVFQLLNKTSVRTIHNYIVWQIIEKAIPLMPEKFREAKNAFEQRTIGQTRNLDCVDALIVNGEVAVTYLYIEKFFDGTAKNKSVSIMRSIRNQVDRFLTDIRWMDNNTNGKIIETLKNVSVVFPHTNLSSDFMEKFKFQSNDSIFANYRRLAESHRILKYSRLRMSREADRHTIPFQYGMAAEALTNLYSNVIYMLAAIFQRPAFSVEQPMYLNYGGFGFIMAHELTHVMGIESTCVNDSCPSFDGFQERKECMEELYGGYVLKQLNESVDGKKTMGENIGDLIGLKLAYRAYEEFARGGEEQLLPGLNYTARQLFWINAATFLCSYESDAALRHLIKTDEHSPAEARVNVAFANTEEFARDFACPIGSRMNPVHKCGFQ